MILQKDITAWRATAPWPSAQLVEHDLILSRAICELYQVPTIREHVVFRGGTALHKLFFKHAGRFSEDLDFVQIKAEPIGPIIKAIRNCLDPWLGQPKRKQNQGRFILNYRFETEVEPIITRKVKIEINTREHFNVQPYVKKQFQIKNDWFQGDSQVTTYSLEELLATKLRALYQRKKGRDLYDFWYAVQHVPNIDVHATVEIFLHYMQAENSTVSRAEFEENILMKQADPVFNHDITPLLSAQQVHEYDPQHAYQIVLNDFIKKLPGEPWKGKKSHGQ